LGYVQITNGTTLSCATREQNPRRVDHRRLACRSLVTPISSSTI
jgi:hypothetical protein